MKFMKALGALCGVVVGGALLSYIGAPLPTIAQGVGQLGVGQIWGNPTTGQNVGRPTPVIDSLVSTTANIQAHKLAVSQSAASAANRLVSAKLADFVHVKDYGAVGNGTTDDAAAINAALAAASSLGVNKVIMDGSTYLIGSVVNMRANVSLEGNNKQSTIKQKASTNLQIMIDFTANSAAGAALRGLTIDGNRANETDATVLGSDRFLVYIGNANDAIVEDNILQNAPGYAIDVSTGLRPIVRRNSFTNFCQVGVGILTASGGTATRGQIVDNVFRSAVGSHAIHVSQSDYNLIARNRIDAVLIGDSTNVLRVDTNGTAVTYKSGPTFTSANVAAGQFLIVNGGNEYQINSIASAGGLTLGSSAGVLSNTFATIGSGDSILVNAGSQNMILDNYVANGSTGGIVITNAAGGAPASENLVASNILYYTGESAINIQDSGTGQAMASNSVIGNKILNSGQGQGANSAAGKNGIVLNGSGVTNTFITDNHIVDGQASKTIQYWLYPNGPTAGQVSIGVNDYSAVGSIGFAGASSVASLTGADLYLGTVTVPVIYGGATTGSRLALQSTSVTGTGNTDAVDIKTGGVTAATFDKSQHVKFFGTIPTVPVCGGGSPTVTTGSTDVVGELTEGTTVSLCKLFFAGIYATAPFCVVTAQTTAATINYNMSTTGINITHNNASGMKVNWHCNGN